MHTPDLSRALESILFAAGEPITFQHLAKTLGTDVSAVAESLDRLSERLAGGGLSLVRHEHTAELVTHPDSAALVEAFQKSERQDALSRPALEVLSVIAYRGPISRTEIEAIRGVNCSFTLRNLLLRGLITREDGGGNRGYLYTVSFDFLKHLGLAGTSALPDYDVLSQDERALGALAAQAEADAPSAEAPDASAQPLDSAVSSR